MESSILLIFVVECNKTSMSDAIYLNYFIRTFHAKEYLSNKVVIRFVFMGGKHNYNKNSVINEINCYIREASINRLNYNVVYCIDTDRNNNKNSKYISNVIQYCRNNNYNLVLFNPEIEYLFNVRITNSKSDCAYRFKKHEPPKDAIVIKRFLYDDESVMNISVSSNLETEIRKILKFYGE